MATPTAVLAAEAQIRGHQVTLLAEINTMELGKISDDQSTKRILSLSHICDLGRAATSICGQRHGQGLSGSK